MPGKPLSRSVLIGFVILFGPCVVTRAFCSDAQRWAVRMAGSEMTRQGDALCFGGPKGKWAYETGVLLKGLEATWKSTGDEKYFDYSKRVVDSYVGADGSIKTYKLEDYNLDNINMGKQLLTLFDRTGDQKYKKAADRLMEQLKSQPRTNEGGFWHKKIYPYQMWLDGIYMASPFYAQYSLKFNQPAGFDDVANQIIWMENHARDGGTGLLYHGWDESRKQEWADPVTGLSKSFWGRSMGWYAMALVDVLDYLPASHPKRAEVITILQRLSAALVKFQDPQSGLWYQVVDQGSRKGNFLEASCSSMFVYALAKGARKGYIPPQYASASKKGHAGLVSRLVKTDPDGRVNLTQVCSVGGLGGPNHRNGTFEYYMSEPVVSNDLKGVGAFIMASIEIDLLAGK